MEHRDCDDEGEEEPVRHINVRFLALPQCPEENEQVDDPNDRQQNVCVPLRLGILPALRDAQHISRGR